MVVLDVVKLQTDFGKPRPLVGIPIPTRLDQLRQLPQEIRGVVGVVVEESTPLRAGTISDLLAQLLQVLEMAERLKARQNLVAHKRERINIHRARVAPLQNLGGSVPRRARVRLVHQRGARHIRLGASEIHELQNHVTLAGELGVGHGPNDNVGGLHIEVRHFLLVQVAQRLRELQNHVQCDE